MFQHYPILVEFFKIELKKLNKMLLITWLY